MAFQMANGSDNVEEIWKTIVNETITCVLDDSPNDANLASYLGRGVENKYRVPNNEAKNLQLDHIDNSI